MCVCVCVCVCMCVCVCVCVCGMLVCVYVFVHVRAHQCVCTRARARLVCDQLTAQTLLLQVQTVSTKDRSSESDTFRNLFSGPPQHTVRVQPSSPPPFSSDPVQRQSTAFVARTPRPTPWGSPRTPRSPPGRTPPGWSRGNSTPSAPASCHDLCPTSSLVPCRRRTGTG